MAKRNIVKLVYLVAAVSIFVFMFGGGLGLKYLGTYINSIYLRALVVCAEIFVFSGVMYVVTSGLRSFAPIIRVWIAGFAIAFVFYVAIDIAASDTGAALLRLVKLLNWRAVAIISAMVLIVGVAVFQVRQYTPSFYGLVEVLIGIAVSLSTMPDVLGGRPNSILQFSAGIYIIVRGLDNINKGVKNMDSNSRVYRAWFAVFPKT